jgi:hypothetical protein
MRNVRTRLRPSVIAVAVAAALALVPAGAARTAASPADGSLVVTTLTSSAGSAAALSVTAAGTIARVVVTAPAGYGIELGHPPGTEIGFASGLLANITGSGSSFVDGAITAVDPATQVGTPESEACAPGRHDAVWRTTLSVLGQSFPMAIYIDRATPAQASSSFVLKFCPVWSAPSAPPGVTARQLTLVVFDSVSRPTADGRYTWSGLVSPVGSELGPDEARTFEVRAVEAIPNTLTLAQRHDPKRRTVTLSGTVTAAGQPVAGARVRFAASTNSASDTTFFGPVTTNASGQFSITHSVVVTTRFSADVEGLSLPCTAPSTAPAGCAQETVGPPAPAAVVVRVRLATDPKLVPRRRDQAAARRASLGPGDFPEGWEAFESFSPFECRGFRPKLQKLTATGDVDSRIFGTQEAAAASRATVYANEAQARTAYSRVAGIGLARCYADELRADGVDILELRAVPFAKLGNETKAFRVVYDVDEFVVTEDFVYFRNGRTVGQLLFAAVAQPLPIAEALARKVAARARS